MEWVSLQYSMEEKIKPRKSIDTFECWCENTYYGRPFLLRSPDWGQEAEGKGGGRDLKDR